MGENPVVEAKRRLTSSITKETENLKTKYEKLQDMPEVEVKKYFAHHLQLFCGYVDQTRTVIETYFTQNSVPVGLIRSMESYYATLKVMLSEFPEVAMDPKLEKAVQTVFIPYKRILGKMSKIADQYEVQHGGGKAAATAKRRPSGRRSG